MDAGPAPNYVDPPTRAGLLFGFMVPLAVLMTATVAIRFYIRGYVRRVLGWDDWIMLLAWVSPPRRLLNLHARQEWRRTLADTEAT